MKKVISTTKLYRLWEGMKARCNNQTEKNIAIMEAVELTFVNPGQYENFQIWALSNGYEPGLEIDRKDNNGNYEPENCSFVTHSKNNLNKRKRKDNNTGYTGITFHSKMEFIIMKYKLMESEPEKAVLKQQRGHFQQRKKFIKINKIEYANQ